MTPEMQILEARIRALAGDVGELRARQNSISGEIEEAPRQRITRRWSEDQYNGPFAVRGIEGNTKLQVGQNGVNYIAAGVNAWAQWPNTYSGTTAGDTAYTAGHNVMPLTVPGAGSVGEHSIWMGMQVYSTDGEFRSTIFPRLVGTAVPLAAGIQAADEVYILLASYTVVKAGICSAIYQEQRSHIYVPVHQKVDTYGTVTGYYVSLQIRAEVP